MPFAKEFVDNLAQVIDLSEIDYIVANHGEVDHSGALPELMARISDVPIYCIENFSFLISVRAASMQLIQNWSVRPIITSR